MKTETAEVVKIISQGLRTLHLFLVLIKSVSESILKIHVKLAYPIAFFF